ncbi:Poly(3-hydroxyalkanoate) polymerase subunit PhaC [Nymphon striatum]|nr:Poly(3-hydroxyalkanoate) polymerase subunit PhaC [Nymphon striatum]
MTTTLKIGDSASITRSFTEQDVIDYAELSGDKNPAHLDEVYAAQDSIQREFIMSTSNPFDFSKAFEQFDPSQIAEKMQSAFNMDAFNENLKGKFDFDAVKASQEKNLALLMSTNQTFADSSKALLERQADMLKQAMTEATEAAQTLASSGSPQEAATKQAELIQQAYEKALANSTEISEMAQKTQQEISEKNGMSDSKQEDVNTLGFGAASEEMRNNFKHVEDLMKLFTEAQQPKDMDPFKLNDAYTKCRTYFTSEYMRNSVSDVEGLDEKTAEKVKFFTERYLDSMSPTNFASTNPAVIEKVIETKGANLVHGLKNMIEDLEEGEGQLKIRMTDTSAFTLGENVASTPGKVVFQNKMFQLIQYTPTTDTVLKRPLLIVPPWINKFYILDLQPKNSLLKWAVDQGHTVFVVSWINPDETYKEVGFDDYVTEGVVTAVDAVEQATGESEINAIGYCIGGTLLSTSLAYMKANGDERVKSATFFTTMIDFAEPGELGVFIDEDQIAGLEKVMEEEGCLKGSKMSWRIQYATC